jgi:hypothetical protein
MELNMDKNFRQGWVASCRGGYTATQTDRQTDGEVGRQEVRRMLGSRLWISRLSL